MNILLIIFIAIGLAIDAFVISITKGMTNKTTLKHDLTIAFFFGGSQAVMAILGWLLGLPLEKLVSTLAPWIAFILISIIGIKMIYESFNEEDETDYSFSYKEIFIIAILTSIDAFVVGISLALLKNPILEPAIIIGIMAFVLSFIGVYLGKKLGHLFGSEIEILGGVILILIGISLLIY